LVLFFIDNFQAGFSRKYENKLNDYLEAKQMPSMQSGIDLNHQFFKNKTPLKTGLKKIKI
jgi:hypothetical protein